MNLLIPFISIFLFVSAFILIFDVFNEKQRKQYGLFSSCLVFFLSLFLLFFFDYSTPYFQFLFEFKISSILGYSIFFGVDGISLFFILLTTLLTPICLLVAWDLPKRNLIYKVQHYYSCFLLIESFLIIVFSTLDLLVFYVFFESVLIPMFVIIGIWGSRERKIRAGFLFFIYTLFGSLVILLGILVLFLDTGTLNYQTLLFCCFSENRQKLLWLAFFASFAVKVPILPVHIWLPEAHVEAPTGGSVILAGILLKLGTYGIIRFLLPLFPFASHFYQPFVFLLSTIAILYTSITAFRQSDIKRVIAYASVAHINITLVGLFSFNLIGIEGSILQILSHGLVSGALFLCVGVLYDRHHTRLIKYYGGVAHTIPIFVSFFLFFTMANIALPGTSSFVGEFLIIIGVFSCNTVVGFFSATSIILGGLYSLWLFNRVSYGNIKIKYVGFSIDLNKKEYYSLIPLIFLVLVMGIIPNFFLEPIHSSCNFLTNCLLIK